MRLHAKTKYLALEKKSRLGDNVGRILTRQTLYFYKMRILKDILPPVLECYFVQILNFVDFCVSMRTIRVKHKQYFMEITISCSK